MKHILVFIVLLTNLFQLYGQTEVNVIIIKDTFGPRTKAILDEASQTLEEIINSDRFRELVHEENFNIGNLGLSSEEIHSLIISGADNYKNKPNDGKIDLRLWVFDKYAGSNNYGFTNMRTRVTRTHRCFMLGNNIDCYIGHLAHEYMHQIGFKDKRKGLFGKKTSSVPYKIGRIVKEILNSNVTCKAIKGTCTKDEEMDK